MVFAVGRYCRRSDAAAAPNVVGRFRRPRLGGANNRSCACQSCGCCIQSFVTMSGGRSEAAEESKAVPDQIDGNPGEDEQHQDDPAARNPHPERRGRFATIAHRGRGSGLAGLLLPSHVRSPFICKSIAIGWTIIARSAHPKIVGRQAVVNPGIRRSRSNPVPVPRAYLPPAREVCAKLRHQWAIHMARGFDSEQPCEGFSQPSLLCEIVGSGGMVGG